MLFFGANKIYFAGRETHCLASYLSGIRLGNLKYCPLDRLCKNSFELRFRGLALDVIDGVHGIDNINVVYKLGARSVGEAGALGYNAAGKLLLVLGNSARVDPIRVLNALA